MSNLKFRAWDGVRFRYDVALDARGFVWCVLDDVPDVNDLMLTECDFPITQFTGLHDADGKRIYVGDYLDMWYAPQATCKGAVTFDHGAFYFETNEATPWKELLHNIPEYGNSLRVIGNRFENPELLEAS